MAVVVMVSWWIPVPVGLQKRFYAVCWKMMQMYFCLNATQKAFLLLPVVNKPLTVFAAVS